MFCNILLTFCHNFTLFSRRFWELPGLSRPEALALPLFSVPIYGGMFQESGLSEAEVACQTMSLGRHELFRSSGWHNKAELSLTK